MSGESSTPATSDAREDARSNRLPGARAGRWERWRRRWPEIRAALVALHIVAIFLPSCPTATGAATDRRTYRRPQVVRQLEAWSRFFAAIGVEASTRDLAELARTWSERIVAVRRVLLAPFHPYYEYFGTQQGWHMFSAAQEECSRIEVHIEEEAGRAERPLYVGRSDEHRWRAHQLDHELFRSALHKINHRTDRHRTTYDQLATWLARMAARDFPEARRARVRVWRTKTPRPEDGDEPRRGRYVRVRWFDLEELR